MDTPIKEWGPGIPEYTKDDILEGNELYQFCAEVVAKQMQSEGFNIKGIAINGIPTQVIAEKGGQRYSVMVAADVFPYIAKASFRIKKEFVEFCKKDNVIPEFASVGIMSIDPIRAAEGLTLKYDGYNFRYTGNERLGKIKKPKKNADDYKAYVMEQILEAYKNADFKNVYKFFDKKAEYHSQWVLEPMIGLSAIKSHLDGKSKAMNKSSNPGIQGYLVEITESAKKSGNVVLMSETGKVCVLICQKLKNETSWVFISADFNKKNKISKFYLNDPSLYNFRKYYVYD